MDSDSLVAPFTVEEVEYSLKCSDSSKALGLDRFNYLFYKKVWHLIKEEVFSIFLNF